MYYLFHGPEGFLRSRALGEIKAQVGTPDLRDLNTSTLDGRQMTYAKMVHTCDAIPFLSDRRLVIVEGLVARLATRGRGRSSGDKEQALLDDLVAYIPRLPPTTDLVLVEEEVVRGNHPLIKVAQEAKGVVRAFSMLSGRELERWLSETARAKGLKIDARALSELALHVGNNLRLLDLELNKLATYAGPGKVVTVQEVQRLVSYVREESIFELVDSIGQQNSARAVQLFHQLLEEGKDPLYVFAMVTRQFRLLLQAQSLLGQRTTKAQFMEALEIRHAFIADKLVSQARNFSLERLKGIYRDLQRLDVAIKTGQVEAGLGLDVFIAHVCRREAPVRAH